MDNKKNPDEILKKIKEIESKEKIGKLRIFFGMVAGVGKTYQMIESAHISKKDGKDIVIGYIETHKRIETEKMAEDLEIIPRKEILYKETIFTETDLDAIIERKPEIVLIDELAHTNVPGSRHKKRYQDILELLNLGMDVWTTVNVQHLESRASIVEQITGIQVKETVPDFIIEMADKIEIIDIHPQELQKRLKEGKIYAKEKVDLALNNFFREGNINALRELSLQVVAKLVDKDITDYRNEHNITDLWKASEKLLVAVGPSPFSSYLIKWTKKTAFNMKADWIAVNIENSKELTKEQKNMLNKNIDLARQLGARIITIADENIVKGIIRTAKEYNVSQVVVGKPLFFNVKKLLQQSITDRLIRESGDIDVYVVTAPGAAEKLKYPKLKRFKSLMNTKEKIGILSFLLVITLIGELLQNVISYWGVSLLYLLYIIFISSFYSRTASLFVSILSGLIWNYLFIPPKYTLLISKPEDFMMYLVFFIVALVTGNLTSKLHSKEIFLKKREKNLELLYELSQEIANNTDFDRLMEKAVDYIKRYFNLETSIFLVNGDKEKLYSENMLGKKEKDIAYWVIKNGIPAGKNTSTLSESLYHFYPIKSTDKTEGVIIIKISNKKFTENEEFLKTVSFMLGSSILKENIIKIKQEMIIEQETEKLYSIILRSISHELKTPVTSIALSANGLCDEKLSSDKNTREILVNDILEANDRLNRVITNLLDMTRIESGRLKLNLQWNDINDLLVSSSNKYIRELKDYELIKEIKNVIPPLKLDFGLIEQVISNLLYNAIIHTPKGTKIILSSSSDEDNYYIEVIDNGGGIKSIDKIFDKFYKEHPKKTGGLGIGLSICKSIIDYHKWNLEAFNNDLGGATFKITIPFEIEYNE